MWKILSKKLLLNVSNLNIPAFFQAFARNRFGFPMESHFPVDIYQVVMDVDSNFCLVNSDLLGPDELPNRSDYCAGVIASSLVNGEQEKIISFNQPQ